MIEATDQQEGNPYPCPRCGRPGGPVTISGENTICEDCQQAIDNEICTKNGEWRE